MGGTATYTRCVDIHMYEKPCGCAFQAWCSLKCISVDVNASNAFLFVALHVDTDDLSSKDITLWFCLSQCPLIHCETIANAYREPNCCHLVTFIVITENSNKKSAQFSEADEWILTEVKRQE